MPLGPQAPVVAVKEGPEGISIGLPSALDARYELWRPRPSASELASCKTLASGYGAESVSAWEALGAAACRPP